MNNKLKTVHNFTLKKIFLNCYLYFQKKENTLSFLISQGYSLHFWKSSRGVGDETVERDNIL
jgi:hypothetical protein